MVDISSLSEPLYGHQRQTKRGQQRDPPGNAGDWRAPHRILFVYKSLWGNFNCRDKEKNENMLHKDALLRVRCCCVCLFITLPGNTLSLKWWSVPVPVKGQACYEINNPVRERLEVLLKVIFWISWVLKITLIAILLVLIIKVKAELNFDCVLGRHGIVIFFVLVCHCRCFRCLKETSIIISWWLRNPYNLISWRKYKSFKVGDCEQRFMHLMWFRKTKHQKCS